MPVPPLGSIPGSAIAARTLDRLRRFFTTDNGTKNEEPKEWQLIEQTPERTQWYNDSTEQFVVCKQQYEGAWTARAKPALIDGEEVDLSLTAGPTTREIAEFLAEQYIAHELVLAPITAMQPRR